MASTRLRRWVPLQVRQIDRPRRRVAREALVASLGTGCGLLPRLSVAPGGDHGRGLTRGDGGMTAPGVIGSVGADLVDGLVDGDLVQQFGQHRRIPNPAASHFDRSDLQRIRINPEMDLPPLSRFGRPVLLSEPLAFAFALDPGTIDQQV